MTGLARTPFALVPDWVDERVTDGTAMRVYVRLARKYCNNDRYAFPTIDTLGGELDLSPATVKRAIDLLKQTGAIQVTRTRRGDGNYAHNVYRLPIDNPHQGSNMSSGADLRQPVHQSSYLSSHQGSNMSSLEPDLKEEPDGSKHSVNADASTATEQHQLTLVEPPTASQAGLKKPGHDDDVDFGRFWQVYPRKVGKKAAWRAWVTAVKGQDPDAVIAAAGRYAASRRGEDPTFTAHPATWLRAGRWDDEPEPVRNGATAVGDGVGEVLRSVSVHRGGQRMVPERWFGCGRVIPADWVPERDPFERVPRIELPDWHWRRFSDQ